MFVCFISLPTLPDFLPASVCFPFLLWPLPLLAPPADIQPGQGLYFTTLTNSWRAKNCITNSYGVSNKTFGLTPYACRDCPANMVTVNNASYPKSSAFFVDNNDTTKGFIDVRACVTVAGYGYNGRVAQACDMGYYNGKDNYDLCKKCDYGLTTAGVGAGVAPSSCGLAAGFGLDAVSKTILPCAIGE